MRDCLLYTVILTVCASSKLLLTDCTEEEFMEIRKKYEDCAGMKISNITELLQNGNIDSNQNVFICDEVKQLINHCGNLLSKCFKSEQIEDTKKKQTTGIRAILSKRFTSEQIDQCFIDSSTPSNNQQVDDVNADNPSSETSPSLSKQAGSNPAVEEVITRTVSTPTVQVGHSSPPWDASGDQGTTPNPTLPTKCEAAEYQETRQHYEVCASNKIREITAWLERRERRRRSEQGLAQAGEEERKSILTVCNSVRQLLYDCGNELGWCFTEDQVSETRFKQKAGLEEILSKYYSTESLKMCFVEQSLSFSSDVEATAKDTMEIPVTNQENRTKPRVTVNDRRPKFFTESEKSSSESYSKGLFIMPFFITSIPIIFN